MTNYKQTLDNYLQDLTNPSWSSKGLEDLFSSLDGSKAQKLNAILKHIEQKFSGYQEDVNQTQFNFLRQITLFNYYGKEESIESKDLEWLLTSFVARKTQVKAMLLALLLPLESLDKEVTENIEDLLKESPAQEWIK